MFQDFDNLEFQQDIMGMVYLCSTMSGVLVGKTKSGDDLSARGCIVTPMSSSRCWILAEPLHVYSSCRLSILITW